MIDLLDPPSKYFRGATEYVAEDYNYWYTDVPGELSRTGDWIYWDYDGYQQACYFKSEEEGGGLPDFVDPDILYCTVTTSVTHTLCMIQIEGGYSGRWSNSGDVLCLAGVPTDLQLEFSSFGYGHDAIAFAVIGESSDSTFTLVVTKLTLGAEVPVTPIMPFWKDFVNCLEVDN